MAGGPTRHGPGVELGVGLDHPRDVELGGARRGAADLLLALLSLHGGLFDEAALLAAENCPRDSFQIQSWNAAFLETLLIFLVQGHCLLRKNQRLGWSRVFTLLLASHGQARPSHLAPGDDLLARDSLSGVGGNGRIANAWIAASVVAESATRSAQLWLGDKNTRFVDVALHNRLSRHDVFLGEAAGVLRLLQNGRRNGVV